MPKAFPCPCSGLHSISLISQRTRKAENISLRNGSLSQESTLVLNVDNGHERKKLDGSIIVQVDMKAVVNE